MYITVIESSESFNIISLMVKNVVFASAFSKPNMTEY